MIASAIIKLMNHSGIVGPILAKRGNGQLDLLAPFIGGESPRQHVGLVRAIGQRLFKVYDAVLVVAGGGKCVFINAGHLVFLSADG